MVNILLLVCVFYMEYFPNSWASVPAAVHLHDKLAPNRAASFRQKLSKLMLIIASIHIANRLQKKCIVETRGRAMMENNI